MTSWVIVASQKTSSFSELSKGSESGSVILFVFGCDLLITEPSTEIRFHSWKRTVEGEGWGSER